MIAEQDLVPVNAEREAFIETRAQEVDLPLRFTVVYQDLERDADIGTQYAKRVAGPSSAMHSHNVATFDLPLMLTITSSVAIVNDTTWSTLVGTWRPGRLDLCIDGFSRASSTAAGTSTSALSGIYRWGWGFSTNQDFNGDIALFACFASILDPRHGAAVARRSVRLPAPMERGACAHGQCATLNTPFDRHRRGHLPDGIASNRGFGLSKLPRVDGAVNPCDLQGSSCADALARVESPSARAVQQGLLTA